MAPGAIGVVRARSRRLRPRLSMKGRSMNLKTTAVSLTAALAMMTTPALANASHTHKATAPGQLCKTFSHKKTDHGKGQSPFAACVRGATLARSHKAEAPGQICKGESKKKIAPGKKTLFAACVTGVAKARH